MFATRSSAIFNASRQRNFFVAPIFSSASSLIRPPAMAFTLMGLRSFSSRVFVQGIPVDWDEHEVNARFSLAGPLNRVHFVKSAQGLRTGKVVIEYASKDSADKAISRFDNQAVDGLICYVKPFFTK